MYVYVYKYMYITIFTESKKAIHVRKYKKNFDHSQHCEKKLTALTHGIKPVDFICVTPTHM